MNEKKLNFDLSKSVCDAINQLSTRVGPAVLQFWVLLLIMLSIPGQSRKYGLGSSNRANAIQSLEFFTLAMTRRLLPIFRVN